MHHSLMVNGLTLFNLLLHKVSRPFGDVLVLGVVRNLLQGAFFALIAAEFGGIMLGAPDFLSDTSTHLEHSIKIKSLLLLFLAKLVIWVALFESFTKCALF